jgi:hypothetical protein
MTPFVYTSVYSVCRDFVYTFPCGNMGVNGLVYSFVYLKKALVYLLCIQHRVNERNEGFVYISDHGGSLSSVAI